MATLNQQPDTAADAQACETNFLVRGMDCASCVASVTKAIKKVPGVRDVSVNLALGRANVTYDATTPADTIAAAATDAGYPAQAATAELAESHDDHHAEHARQWLARGIVGLVLWLPVEIAHWTLHHEGHLTAVDWLSLATSTIAIVFIGGAFYRSAFNALKRGTSNMDTLIALGASVAYGYSAIALIGHLAAGWPLAALYFNEATALLALISTGHWLEARARTNAGSAIRDLMHLAPTTAWQVPTPAEGKPKRGLSLSVLSQPAAPTQPAEVPVAQLVVGDHVLVRPGDRVPIDGTVVSGVSTIDESMLTGEAVPVRRAAGDSVTGGTVNLDGALTVRVTQTGNATALAQIVKLVETAQNSRPPVQKLADRIAAVFVPSVLAIALITAVGWFVYGHAAGLPSGVMWAKTAKAVCGVLIVACPCALGLAVPAALMVGTGRGSGLGILFRDIDPLQSAESIDTVVLDKTGTITAGRPIVEETAEIDCSRDQLLMWVASAERPSSHPVARAIVEYAALHGVQPVEPTAFLNVPGSGVRATVSGDEVLVGNIGFLRDAGVDMNHIDESLLGKTTVWVGLVSDGGAELVGRLDLTDQLKVDSQQAVSRLQSSGITTILLSGDSAVVAQKVAGAVGITDVRANMKPDGKAAAVVELKRAGRKVAMVGDGINDAPALAAADLGIAIGTGSDIAKETGGIVLVSGSLSGVPTAINLSKATMRVIRQNLFFAFVYNVLAIPLAAFGLLSPIVCAAAMALSDVTVIGNALLLKRRKL